MSTFLDSAAFRLADRVELRNGGRSVAVTFQVSVVAWNISDEAVEHWALGSWVWSKWRSFPPPEKTSVSTKSGNRGLFFSPVQAALVGGTCAALR